MELKEGLVIEESKALNVLSKIHSSAERYYLNFKNSNKPMNVYSIIGEDNFGILAILPIETRTTILLTFEKDIAGDMSVLEKIKDIVLNEVKARNYENVEFKVNGFNENVNKFLVNNNFKIKYENCEYFLAKESLNLFEKNPVKGKNTLERRDYKMADLNAYANMIDESFKWLNEYYKHPLDYYKDNKENAGKTFEDINKRGGFSAFWKDGSLVGCYLKDDNYLDKLVVNPKFKGMGFGSQILDHCLEHMFKEKEISECTLDVAEVNKKARGLYEKKGFKQKGSYKDYTYEK